MVARPRPEPAAPPEHVVTDPGDAEGWRLRIVRGRAEWWSVDHWIRPAPLRMLARRTPADSATWAWLASHGIERPRLGGAPQAEADRARRVVPLRLSVEARAALDALAEARGVSRSVLVDGLVLAEAAAVAPGAPRRIRRRG